MAQERMKTEENTTISTKVSLDCVQCSKEFQSMTDFDQHRTAMHNQLTASNTTQSSCLTEGQFAVNEEQKPIKELVITSISPLSGLSQRVVELKSATHRDSHLISTHLEPPNAHNDSEVNTQKQIKITQRMNDSVNMLFCWKCSKTFKTARSRLDHFIKNHFTSFLPIANVLSSHPGEQLTSVGEQVNSSNVSINSLSEPHSCWECRKKFKSCNGHISHFIEKHAKTILFIDTDPSSILKNQIAMAQERTKATKDTTIATKTSFNCSQSFKEFKSADARISRFNARHGDSTLRITSKLSSPLHNQTKTMQNQVKTIGDAAHPVGALVNSSKSSREFISTIHCLDHCNGEHIACMSSATISAPSDIESQTEVLQKQTENTEVEFFTTTVHNSFTDPDIMKCLKAKFRTIVYMSLGTYRKSICIEFDKTNRCPHEACKSRTANYGFEELWSHTMMEYKDAKLQLECCDPTTMYTLEEYKNHLLRSD